MANTSPPQLLNPDAPMAWLRPSLAKKMIIALDIAAGSLAVLLWDIILHIPDDYKLLTQSRLNFSIFIYCISRLTSVAYALGLVIVQTNPIFDCSYVRHVNMIFVVAFPSTLLLFVLRVCALYHNQKWVIALFSLSWISVLCASIMLSIGTSGLPIGNTNYCLEIKSPSSSRIAAITPFVHDTLVYLATSWAFMKNSYLKPNVQNGVAVMVWGKHLPAFSRSILRNGQAYYLLTLIANLFFVTLYYFPDKNSGFATPCSFGLPTFVLINTMTCHVYRNVRLGVYHDDIQTSVIQKHLERAGQIDNQVLN